MQFDDFDAMMDFDPQNPQKAKLSSTINPTSLDLPSPPKGFFDELMGENF